jgi:hypothetical protein
MGMSFMYHFSLNYNSLDEIKAPVHVNIEIDKAYAPFVSIIAGLQSGDRLYSLSFEDIKGIRNTILYTEIRVENWVVPFIRKLFLHIPREEAWETLNAIDNIGIFIGNKMFYFSHSDVVNLQGTEKDDYILFELHGLEYEKSMAAALLKMPQWINWYGDFNMAVKTISDFFIHSKKYFFTWIYFICLLFLCLPNIEKIYAAMRKQNLPMPELLLLGFIVFVGFVLRLNGYIRYSSWGDELWSAYTSNPNRSFMSTFEDPGIPPFHFILLRLWFMLFGWTEQSGRFFSVLTGCAAIISLYFLVRRFANKKAAFFAAAYMAVSAYFIGFSWEMRPYILVVFLVSIVALRFLIIIQNRELSFINLILYIIPSVLLVNTHYYGGLFVFATFLFYVVYSIHTKTFTWKKTVVFFTGNLIIASSLLPYFIYTVLQRALLNPAFNTWIPKPGLWFIHIAAIIPLLGIIYIYLRKTVFKKILTGSNKYFLDYSIFVTSVVYLIAFGISLYRPILVERYLIILYPFLIAFFTVIILNVFTIIIKILKTGSTLITRYLKTSCPRLTPPIPAIAFTNSSKLIGILCVGFIFFSIVIRYDTNRGGWSDVYHESLAYISKDAEAHRQNICVEIFTGRRGMPSFYGYNELPSYVSGDYYDVLYFNPLDISEEQMYLEIAKLGISTERVLEIRVNNRHNVFKIYSGALSE